MRHLFQSIGKFVRENNFVTAIIIGFIICIVASFFTDKPVLNWFLDLFGETGSQIGGYIIIGIAILIMAYTLFRIIYMVIDSVKDAKNRKKS